MRAVTAIFLAALTGLSSLVGVASAASLIFIPCAISPKLSAAPLEAEVAMTAWSDKTKSLLELYCIPITLMIAALFLGFAYLCWRLANTVWPNRWFAG